MNLKEWALAQGVHPVTAYRWFREGELPVLDDLVRDVTEVLTFLCARRYGRRSASRRAAKVVATGNERA